MTLLTLQVTLFAVITSEDVIKNHSPLISGDQHFSSEDLNCVKGNDRGGGCTVHCFFSVEKQINHLYDEQTRNYFVLSLI